MTENNAVVATYKTHTEAAIKRTATGTAQEAKTAHEIIARTNPESADQHGILSTQ
jgi:hypothetical protein